MSVKNVCSQNLNLFYGQFQALIHVNIAIQTRRRSPSSSAPSGCGKLTLLRRFNRLNELLPNVRTTGQILLDGHDAYAPAHRPHPLPQTRSGMASQRLDPFPALGFRQRRLRPPRPRHACSPGPRLRSPVRG